jgi:DNA repair protein RecN (Recombination protein N)
MLDELRIRNFAIIDNLELELASGFNVITGETGAGKSIIVDAVEMLLGGKADASMIRSGADRAVIEGVFMLDARTRPLIIPVLRREELLEDETADFITLTREIRSNGRTAARVNGITVNMDVLGEIGGALVDIHGQSEHLSLLQPRHHIDLLDRYADLLEIREALATVVENLSVVRKEMRALQEDKAALERRADQLRHEVEEIEAARLAPGEDDELRAERNRLANSEQLATLSAEAVMLLNGDDSDDQNPAVDALGRVATILEKLAAIDPELADLNELAEGLSAQAQELALEMAGYADEIEYDPHRLNEIEERLELINTLRRRYGVTIDLVLEHGEKARAELGTLEHSEERLDELREKETLLLRQIGELGHNISKVRRSIGQQLSKRVVQELKDLRMEHTRFEVALNQREDPDGCYVNGQRMAFDITGIDDVEFLLSANPGEPLRPLAKVASGGEAARIMLALKRVLTQADHTPILIFDEVDQGIGGRVGSVVGEKLWELSAAHQVMVVTHMPQLAGYADRHYQVRKAISGSRTYTEVVPLDDEAQRVDELAAMLGATGEGSRQSALEILDVARARKTAAPATKQGKPM